MLASQLRRHVLEQIQVDVEFFQLDIWDTELLHQHAPYGVSLDRAHGHENLNERNAGLLLLELQGFIQLSPGDELLTKERLADA